MLVVPVQTIVPSAHVDLALLVIHSTCVSIQMNVQVMQIVRLIHAVSRMQTPENVQTLVCIRTVAQMLIVVQHNILQNVIVIPDIKATLMTFMVLAVASKLLQISAKAILNVNQASNVHLPKPESMIVLILVMEQFVDQTRNAVQVVMKLFVNVCLVMLANRLIFPEAVYDLHMPNMNVNSTTIVNNQKMFVRPEMMA